MSSTAEGWREEIESEAIAHCTQSRNARPQSPNQNSQTNGWTFLSAQPKIPNFLDGDGEQNELQNCHHGAGDLDTLDAAREYLCGEFEHGRKKQRCWKLECRGDIEPKGIVGTSKTSH